MADVQQTLPTTEQGGASPKNVDVSSNESKAKGVDRTPAHLKPYLMDTERAKIMGRMRPKSDDRTKYRIAGYRGILAQTTDPDKRAAYEFKIAVLESIDNPKKLEEAAMVMLESMQNNPAVHLRDKKVIIDSLVQVKDKFHPAKQIIDLNSMKREDIFVQEMEKILDANFKLDDEPGLDDEAASPQKQ